jgi:DNA-binding transcriptional MerR regulator
VVDERPVKAVDGEQGALFPDASLPDELVGYRGPAACQIAGITYRQLDYWARTKLVAPSIRTAHGSGSQRLYSFKDILALKIVKRLLDTGVSLQNIRVAVDYLRARGVGDLARVTLVSDGTTVYECTSPEEIVDLLQGGSGSVRHRGQGADAGDQRHHPRVSGRTGRRWPDRGRRTGRAEPAPQRPAHGLRLPPGRVRRQSPKPRGRVRAPTRVSAPKEQILPGTSQAPGPRGRDASGKRVQATTR